jgi:predicted oxidoreductase
MADDFKKDSNPKDNIGSTKPPIHNVPLSVVAEIGLALAEGSHKYGGYNWRVIGVRASVYWDATFRHIKAWWEGEDTDPDSQLSHITKAISALVVLRDAMIQDNWNDDRPPRSKQTPAMVSEQYKQMLERLKSLQPDPVEGYTQKGIDDAK